MEFMTVVILKAGAAPRQQRTLPAVLVDAVSVLAGFREELRAVCIPDILRFRDRPLRSALP